MRYHRRLRFLFRFQPWVSPLIRLNCSRFWICRKKEPRKLHGRFLHITDMHPDPFYMPHTSQSKACHRKRPGKTKKESGYYGTPYSCALACFRRLGVTYMATGSAILLSYLQISRWTFLTSNGARSWTSLSVRPFFAHVVFLFWWRTFSS